MQAKVVNRWVQVLGTEEFECGWCGFRREYWATLIPGGPDTCPQCGRGEVTAQAKAKRRQVKRRHLRSLRDKTLTTQWDGNKIRVRAG